MGQQGKVAGWGRGMEDDFHYGYIYFEEAVERLCPYFQDTIYYTGLELHKQGRVGSAYWNHPKYLETITLRADVKA